MESLLPNLLVWTGGVIFTVAYCWTLHVRLGSHHPVIKWRVIMRFPWMLAKLLGGLGQFGVVCAAVFPMLCAGKV